FTNTGGTLNISGQAAITQQLGNLNLGSLTANALSAFAPTGSITGTTAVNVLAAQGDSGITITNTAPLGTLTVGTVGSLSGLQSNAGSISLTKNAAILVVAANSNASGAMTFNGGNITVQDAFVTAGGAMNVTASGALNVTASTAQTTLNSGGLQTIGANGLTLQA